jgi:hypothetical protein
LQCVKRLLRDHILLLRQDILIWQVNLKIPEGYACDGFELGYKRGHEKACIPEPLAAIVLVWNW